MRGTHRHSDAYDLIDYGDGETEMVVIPVAAVDMVMVNMFLDHGASMIIRVAIVSIIVTCGGVRVVAPLLPSPMLT